MRPVVKHWRAAAHKIIVYLVDGMGASQSFSSCLNQATRVRSDVISSGFVPSVEKLIWFPTQSLTWLGLDWDLKMKTLSIPQKKINKMLVSINATLVSRKVKVRQLASLTGLIVSNLIVFGNICKLMTKALHRKIDPRSSWDSVLNLDSESINELEFWLSSVSELNCRSISFRPTLFRRVVYSVRATLVVQHSSLLEICQFFIRTGMKQSLITRSIACKPSICHRWFSFIARQSCCL